MLGVCDYNPSLTRMLTTAILFTTCSSKQVDDHVYHMVPYRSKQCAWCCKPFNPQPSPVQTRLLCLLLAPVSCSTVKHRSQGVHRELSLVKTRLLFLLLDQFSCRLTFTRSGVCTFVTHRGRMLWWQAAPLRLGRAIQKKKGGFGLAKNDPY